MTMKILVRHLFVFLFLFTGLTQLRSQNIQVFEKFEEFEKSVFRNNDTIYVINFWATWCKPCIKELPYFENFNKNTSNSKIKVLLVSLDFKNQIKSHLLPFISKNKYTSEFILLSDKDYNTWLEKVDGEWSGSIPATLLISGNKKLFAEREFESENDLSFFVNTFIQSL